MPPRINHASLPLAKPKLLALLGLCIGLLFMSSQATCALAQGTSQETTAVSSERLDGPRLVAPKTTSKVNSKSTWKDLTPEQQQALKPLAEHWVNLSDDRRRKWLVISQNFPALPQAEQAKLHSRMSEWVLLSQHERSQARLNYAETQKLSAEEKAKKWQAYQALSPEEKKKLAATAPTQPVGAAVVKPAPSQKLAHVPTTRLSSVSGSKLAAAKHPVQENTLLPVREAARADADPTPVAEAGSD